MSIIPCARLSPAQAPAAGAGSVGVRYSDRLLASEMMSIIPRARNAQRAVSWQMSQVFTDSISTPRFSPSVKRASDRATAGARRGGVLLVRRTSRVDEDGARWRAIGGGS